MIVENLLYKGIVEHTEDRELLLQLISDASKLIQTASRAVEIECGIGVSPDESIAKNSKKNVRCNLARRAGSLQQDLENLNLYFGDPNIDPKTRWIETRQIAADHAKVVRDYARKHRDTSTEGSTDLRQVSAYQNVMRHNPMADAVAEDLGVD